MSMTSHSTLHSSPDTSDLGCAIDATGKLDASGIVFYNDPDDETPISDLGALPNPSMHPFFSHDALLLASLLVLSVVLVLCTYLPGS